MKTSFTRTIRKGIEILFLLPFLTLTSFCKQQDKPSEAHSPKAEVQTDQPSVDIHTAVLNNDVEAIKHHIKSHSDLNVKDPFGGSTPLISASLFGRTEIVRLLLDAGAKLNIQNNDGSTALIAASFFCRLDIVELLLAKGADKSIKNKYNQTAIETVQAPFSEAKPVYDMLGSALSPMGLKLDYDYLQKTRPLIQNRLK